MPGAAKDVETEISPGLVSACSRFESRLSPIFMPHDGSLVETLRNEWATSVPKSFEQKVGIYCKSTNSIFLFFKSLDVQL